MLKTNIFSKLFFASLILFWALPALAQNPDSIPFLPAVDYGTGYYPISVFCADFDGDLDLDLAVANAYNNDVSILKNNGDGTFQTKVDYAVGTTPQCIFSADLDGDTDLDLAVANQWANSISILENNGDGTFQTKVDYATGSRPVSVFCADLDADTDIDLAVANAYNNDVSILKNNGDGTFQTKVDYVAGGFPWSVFCADLDGDTDLDLAVTNYNSYNVSILKNNGDGTFQTKVDYVAGQGPSSLFCADLDGDTDLDLAVANYNSYNVSILKNNGDGTFQTNVDYVVGQVPYSLFCADLDGDIDLDLAVANKGSTNLSILKNNGNGTFQAKMDYRAGNGSSSVFCADLDSDGDIDLAVANSYSDNVSILKNLTIRQPVELWVDIVGRERIRLGQPQSYSIQCGNLGFSTASNLVILVKIPTSVDIGINLPPPPPEPPTGIGWEQIPLGFVTEDSSFILPIWIPSLGPDSAKGFNLTITAPIGQPNFSVEVTLTQLLPVSQPQYDPWEELLNCKTTWDFYRKWQELEHDDPGWGQQAEEAYKEATRQIFYGIANTYGFGLMLRGLSLAGWELYRQGIIQLFTALAMNSPEFLSSLWSGWSLPESMKRCTRRYMHILPVGSWDPNDKAGPFGIDSIRHYVPAEGQLKYIVYFENVDSATADAEDIVIVDTLDQSLEWSTLEIGDMSHPEPCSASFDAINGVITWTCDSIMLPPDTLPPNGEGWVSFSIKPKSYLSSGTVIKNRASIKFDYNPWMYAPMDSSYIVNTIDAGRPTTNVNSLPDTAIFPDFTVSWSGADDPSGSGIAAYTVYVKTDGGPYLPWLTDTTATSAVFHGELGHTYYFSSTAVDNVGYREERHPTFDTRTIVRSFLRGDPNKDGQITVSDVVYLINYLFKGGPAPNPLQSGDVNCDGKVSVSDVVYLINYLFKGGPPPC